MLTIAANERRFPETSLKKYLTKALIVNLIECNVISLPEFSSKHKSKQAFFNKRSHGTKIRQAGGQAHYYSRTGTLKQRPQPVKLDYPLF